MEHKHAQAIILRPYSETITQAEKGLFDYTKLTPSFLN
jgi:hypothetical protein